MIICDKRPHIGGNAYDFCDEHGILIHRYGPHIFHTNSAEVFRYLSRFTEWRPYQHRVLASVDGQLVPIPINLDTINQLYGTQFTSMELESYFAKVAEPRRESVGDAAQAQNRPRHRSGMRSNTISPADSPKQLPS